MAEASKQEMGKTELDRAMAKVMEEANGVFAKLRSEAEAHAKRGGGLDLLEVAKAAGLGLEAKDLEELHIDRILYPLPWLPWEQWFPWRPLWCWWWNRRYPWYNCCPWWWWRCTWL